jgi:uncharacterized protein YbjQ (UPF0145 family)
MLVVTVDGLPRYEIVLVIGAVLGTVARPRNAFVEGVRSLSGEGDSRYARVLYRSRRQALVRLVAAGRELGANAVVGMRFDHRTIGSWIEICAYGTAVYATPTGS